MRFNHLVVTILCAAGGIAAPGAFAAAPTGAPKVSISQGAGKVTLNWAVVPGATAYNVYQGSAAGAEDAAPVKSGVARSVIISGLSNGSTYYFTVAGVNGGSAGPQSNEVSATPAALPGAPTGFTATAGVQQVSLSWNASAGAASYSILQGTAPGGEGATPVATGIAGTSTTLGGLAVDGTTYYFKVLGVNGSGNGSRSVEAHAMPYLPFGAPGGVSATVGDGQVSLNWGMVPGVAGYNVYRGTSPGNEAGAPVTSTNGTTTSAVVSGLSNGTTYYFTVAATGPGVVGQQSSEVSAKPVATPAAPTGVSATAGKAKVALNWNAVPGATGYSVYQGSAPGAEDAAPVSSGAGRGVVLSGLNSGAPYYFTVKATSASGTGPASSEVSATPSSLTGGATATVRLIAFNDFHGYIDPPGTASVPDPNDATKKVTEPVGGAAYFATLVKQLKAQNPLNVVVGAGDMVGASPLNSALFHDEPTIQALSQIGLEYTSVGNHEFDKGQAELLRKQNGGCFPGGVVGGDTCVNGTFTGASWKYLAANVIDNSTGKPLFDAYAIKSIDVGGGKSVKIAFIGLVLKETPTLVTASGVANLTFADEAATANALLPELQAKGVNAVVVLIHQGIFTNVGFDDKSCAGANGELTGILDQLDPSIPLVISGHTHWSYICPLGQGTAASKVYYTSAGRYGSYLSAVDLTFDTATGKLVSNGISADNKLVVNDRLANPRPAAYPTLAPDAAVAALVNQYDTAAAPLVNKVVGSVTADFTTAGESIASPANGTGESPLGDIIADSQLIGAQVDPNPPVIAFMNPGGIRNSLFLHPANAGIPPSAGIQDGQITYGEAYNVQPFGDILTDMDLTGQQIYDILGQQWAGQTSPKILEVSQGFTYTWDASLPDGASKVVDGSVKLNGVAIDKNATYRVEANNFIAGGGDGFHGFTGGTNLYTGPVDVDTFTAYITAHSPLTPGVPNRITRLH